MEVGGRVCLQDILLYALMNQSKGGAGRGDWHSVDAVCSF